ncbi:hypothetical protein BDK51DRAFT_30478, partial [Blyttiomyces helicus]
MSLDSLGFPPKLIVDFATPEGVYRSVDELKWADVPPNTSIGTTVSFMTIKSVDPQKPPPTSTDPVEPSGQPVRFVEVPVTGDDKGSFSFFRGGKIKKSSKTVSKPSSSFVAKISAHEQLAKLLAYRPAENTYMFFNVGKAFIWADFKPVAKQTLSCIHFKEAFVTCHDVNMLTRDNMDSVIGFSGGDVMWYSPLSGKYARLNRQGVIKKSCVTCIKWMPGSENLFLAGHEDGSIIIYDKEKDDQNFTMAPGDNE